MSNPDEPPGAASDLDACTLQRMRPRPSELFPAVRPRPSPGVGGAIDYTPTTSPHRAASRPGRSRGGHRGRQAGGHGLMWGPGVGRVAADLTTTGQCHVA